jgi:O-acetyl-ADP-ribose deacetylase (regulator of RNase III)
MPILFISLNERFNMLIAAHGYQTVTGPIQEYIPREGHKTFYVSPANSLCFMDGGIDLALSRDVFPGIEAEVKSQVRSLGIQTLLGRNYLPIGSSLILEKGTKCLIVAPTMLLPQNINGTDNVYWATRAILYNILVNRKENLDSVDILMTSMGCGYGKLSEEESVIQILRAIEDYRQYNPLRIEEMAVIHEPNLDEQPKFYMNTEFINIHPGEIRRVK